MSNWIIVGFFGGYAGLLTAGLTSIAYAYTGLDSMLYTTEILGIASAVSMIVSLRAARRHLADAQPSGD